MKICSDYFGGLKTSLISTLRRHVHAKEFI